MNFLSKPHAYQRMLLSIHSQRGRHFDIRVPKVCQLLFPILALKGEKDRSKHERIVQGNVGEGSYVRR